MKLFTLLMVILSSWGWGQVTVTDPGNTTPAMSATYASLALAITDVNNRTSISGPVTITLDASTPQTAPAGGYSITNTAITGGSNTNRFIFDGGGNIITAGVGTSTTTDAFFKIIGADFITLQNFVMAESSGNTTATTQIEWGIALLYSSTTNGAQNCIIQNNTITLNRTNPNSIGIYSNSTHSATAVTTSATATTSAGGNSGLKVYTNTINNVNMGIVVVGPTAVADANTGIDIGGSSLSTGNTISNYGTTTTGITFINVSGTINGILVRNSNGFNISYNSITSSNGGVTATGTLRGIFIPAASNTPTGTFVNSINNNTIALTHGFTSGTIQGVTVEATTGTATSTQNINNNNFTAFGTSAASTSGAITAISCVMPNLITNINNNTFTNITSNTTGSFTFIGHSYTMPANGSMTITGNSIVTGFNKTGAGGTVTCATTGSSSPNSASLTQTNNNFSNITVTGATVITGFTNSDGAGSSCSKTITGNTFNNWTGGSSAITGMTFGYWGGGTTNSLSNNTITNITGQGAITALLLGSSFGGTNTVTVNGNTINNLSSTGTGGQVLGIASANTSTVININGNAINTLSSTGASSAVCGILITGATTTNVFSNTINGMVASGTTSPLALGVSVQGGTTVNTYGNKIYNISATGAISTTSPAVIGLNITSGTTVNSYNNLIGDLTAPAANLVDAIRGISIGSTTANTSYNIYNNTVYLTGSGGANFGTSGIYHAASATATTAALDLQNNMIFNTCTPSGTGIVTAFRRSPAGTLGNYKSTSNKNLFYAGTPSATTTIMSDGTNNYQTLATFQSAVSTLDAGSITESAFTPSTYFVSTTGSNANYLQPASGITTQAEGGGNTITMCSPDFNGVTRPGFSGAAYDVGAWEFAGISPAPVLTNMTPSPALTAQCTKAARAISIDITTASGTITGATLNYNHNGTAQTAVTMTNSSGTTWTGTMLAPSTGNATVTWSITATNSLGLNTLYSGTSYADEPTTGITATATATPSTVCEGSNASLSVSLAKSGTSSTIGSGTAVNSTSSNTGAFYGTWWGNSRTQILITASELTAAGLSAGNITGLNVNVTGGTLALCTGFTIKIGATNASSISTSFATPTFTTVYGPLNYTPTLGVNTHTFSTSFNWDGSSNIIVEYCFSNLVTGTNSATNTTTTTSFASSVLYGADGTTAACGNATVSTSTSVRANILLVGNTAPTPSAYSWSNGPTVVGTTNPLSTPITSGLTYTATATVNGCPITAAVTPTVNPLPTAPTATPSSQCGAGIPTASVADNNSYSTPTFKWYSAASGGTALQTSTSSTYTTSISTTTTFYVAVVGTNTCESARTAVTVTVSQPDAISAVTSAAAICLGQSVTLTAANTATTPTQTYSYSWACATTGSGATSANTNNPASVTPTAAGSYTYTVTGTDGACSAVNTVAVTVNALPNITSATATPSSVCSGEAITLTGASVPSSAGNSTPSGSGSSFTSSSSYPTFFGNYWFQDWSQILYTASELTAMGLVASNFTALKINVGALPDPATVNGYSISIGTTSNSSLSSFQTAGLTTVFSPGNYTVASTGNITITFSTPFYWDGVSNLIVDIRGTGQYGDANATINATNTTQNTVVYASTSSDNTSFWTSSPTPTTSTLRPNIVFTGQIGTNQTSLYTWSWNSTPAIATATGSTTETNSSSSATSKTYTVTATNATTGCTNTASTTITVNPCLATWTGTTSTDWNTTSNWSPAAVPTSSDNIIIPSTGITNFPVATGLTIAAGKTTTLNSNAQLTVNGTLTNNGTLTLESGATLVQGTGNTVAGSGTFNVKQALTGDGGATPSGRFWYLGSPVSTANSGVFNAAGNNRLWTHSEANLAYTEITANNVSMAPLRGHVVRLGANETSVFTGGLLNTGNYSTNNTLTNSGTGTANGYTLVSNPYPSYLNWDDAFAGASGISSSIWYRTFNSTNSTMVFDIYNATGAVATSNAGVTIDKYIPPMQAFWIYNPTNGTSGSVTFSNSMRSHQNNGGLKDAIDFPAFVRLNLENDGAIDQTVLYFDNNAAAGYDNFDSDKMMLANFAQVYSFVDNKKLAINGMKSVKANKQVPLTVEFPTAKSYSFNATEVVMTDGIVILEDRLTKVFQDLTMNPVYNFDAAAGTDANRFVVHFQANSGVAGIETAEDNGIAILSNASGLVTITLSEELPAMGTIQIIDINGKVIATQAINEQTTTMNINAATGVYHVLVDSASKVARKKIVITK
jgi:hypothetical protein